MTYQFNVPTVPQTVVQFQSAPTTENLDLVASVINYHYNRPPGVAKFTAYIKDMSDAGDKLLDADVILDLLELVIKVASYNRSYAYEKAAEEKRAAEASLPRGLMPQAGDDDLPF